METTLRRPNLLKRVASLIAPPEVLEFWISRINPLWSLEHARARVVSREIAADGATALLLKPNRDFRGFRAGQHVNLKIEIDGVLHTRSYSFASAPRADGMIRLVVRAVDGGKVSEYLQTIPVGTVIALSAAYGGLRMPSDPDRPTVMLAAGSGITPMLSLIDQESSSGFSRPIHLLYWARDSQQMIDRDALQELSSSILRVNFIETSTNGRINEAQLREVLSSKPNILACGSHGFVEAARVLTEGKCASFQSESFTPPNTAVENEVDGEAEVTLLRSGKTITVPRNQSLLEALEANGLKPAHGCRMGICNTCSCRKSNGTARNLLDGKLHREVSQSIRICVHAAQSDLTLDL